MERFFQALWYQARWRWFAYLLWPLSFFYWLGGGAAKWWGSRNRPYFHVPIIVVGNLTTGGTGKTPVLIALCEFLTQHGFRVGVVSRGYKSLAEHAKTPTLISQKSLAQDVGDEPLLIFQKTKCPVAVHAKRFLAVDALLQTHPDLDLILSDDGLQNPRLAREMEIVVVDGVRGFGNGLLLPVGPLRESKKSLRDADFCVVNGEPLKNLELPLDYSVFKFLPFPLTPTLSLEGRGKIRAITGIGHPERFFKTLRDLGLEFMPYVFPDHYAFSPADFKGMEDDYIIMTEKDMVKCQDFGLKHAYALKMQGILDTVFLNAFLNKVRYTIEQKKKDLVLFKTLRKTHEQKPSRNFGIPHFKNSTRATKRKA